MIYLTRAFVLENVQYYQTIRLLLGSPITVPYFPTLRSIHNLDRYNRISKKKYIKKKYSFFLNQSCILLVTLIIPNRQFSDNYLDY